MNVVALYLFQATRFPWWRASSRFLHRVVAVAQIKQLLTLHFSTDTIYC